MGQNTVKAYGSQGRQDLLQFDPEDLVLVEDESSPLYDKRVHDPIDEAMVLDVMERGVHTPISVRKNGERNDGTAIVEVVKGRWRTRHAREANKRLKKMGRMPIKVPATVVRGDEKRMLGLIISENEHRHEDTPLSRAHKAQRMMEYGATEEEVAIAFGKSVATIRHWAAILDCSRSVQRAVESGKITATLAAKELSKLPRDKQDVALVKLIESGAKGDKAKREVEQHRKKTGHGAEPKKRMRNIRDVESLAKFASEQADQASTDGNEEAAASWLVVAETAQFISGGDATLPLFEQWTKAQQDQKKSNGKSEEHPAQAEA